MKTIIITYTHNKLREGDFPQSQLEDQFKDDMSFETERVDSWNTKYTITLTVPKDEDKHNLIFEFGMLVGGMLISNLVDKL